MGIGGERRAVSETGLPPVAAGIFTGSGDNTSLIGSRCSECKRIDFPARVDCVDCGDGTPDIVPLSRRGTLYSYTVVRTRPPFGLPAPYALGYVDLAAEGLRVLMPLDAKAIGGFAIGMPLVLVSGPLGVDLAGHACIRPFFTPERG